MPFFLSFLFSKLSHVPSHLFFFSWTFLCPFLDQCKVYLIRVYCFFVFFYKQYTRKYVILKCWHELLFPLETQVPPEKQTVCEVKHESTAAWHAFSFRDLTSNTLFLLDLASHGFLIWLLVKCQLKCAS